MNPQRIALAALRGLGYLTFFLVCLVMFALWTFPTDRAREFLEERGGAMVGGDVRIGELDLEGIGGAELLDVAVRLPEKKQDPNMPDPTADSKPKLRLLRIDRAELDVGVLALLLNKEVDATFEADLQGGTVRGGRLEMRPEVGQALLVEAIEGVQLGPEGLFSSLMGYDLQGVLGGTIDIKRGLDASELSGVVDVALSRARIVKPVIPTKQLGPIPLSDVDMGELQLKLSAGTQAEVGLARKGKSRRAEETVIRFEDVGASGPDLEIEFDDSSVIRLREGEPLGRAVLDVHFAVHFTDAFLDKRVKAKDGSTSQPNRILRMAFRQDARLRGSMRDGVLGIACRGMLSRPDCRPEPPRIRGGFKKRKPRFTTEGGDEPAEPAAEPEAEAPADEGEAESGAAARRRTGAAERAPTRNLGTARPRPAARPRTPPVLPTGRAIPAPTTRAPAIPAGRVNLPRARPVPEPEPEPEVDEELLEEGHDTAYPEDDLPEGEELPLEEGEELPLEEGEELPPEELE